jgi:hypothetical protein
MTRPPNENIAVRHLGVLRTELPSILAKCSDPSSPRMMRIIDDLAGDWRRLDERIEGLSTDITSLVEGHHWRHRYCAVVRASSGMLRHGAVDRRATLGAGNRPYEAQGSLPPLLTLHSRLNRHSACKLVSRGGVSIDQRRKHQPDGTVCLLHCSSKNGLRKDCSS